MDGQGPVPVQTRGQNLSKTLDRPREALTPLGYWALRTCCRHRYAALLGVTFASGLPPGCRCLAVGRSGLAHTVNRLICDSISVLLCVLADICATSQWCWLWAVGVPRSPSPASPRQAVAGAPPASHDESCSKTHLLSLSGFGQACPGSHAGFQKPHQPATRPRMFRVAYVPGESCSWSKRKTQSRWSRLGLGCGGSAARRDGRAQVEVCMPWIR